MTHIFVGKEFRLNQLQCIFFNVIGSYEWITTNRKAAL